MDLDSYLKLTNSTEETWAEQTRPQAEERLKRNLLLAQVVQEEELTVEADEVDAEIERMAESLGEQGDQFREVFSSPTGRVSITEGLLTRMAMERLMAIARGEDPVKGPLAPEEEEQAALETDEAAQGAEGEGAEADPEAEKAEDEPVGAAEAEVQAAVETAQVAEAETETPAETETEGEAEAEGEAEDEAEAEALAPVDDESSAPAEAEIEPAIDADSPGEDAATEAE